MASKKRDIIVTILEFTAIPTLRGLSAKLARKDADTVGSDDRLARVLNTAADEAETYCAEYYEQQP